MRNRWVGVSLFLAACLSGPVQAQSGEYASRFVKTIRVPTANDDSVASLVYGNADYGYFETSEVSVRGEKVTARLVPPGFRSALEFYLRKTDAGGDSYLERAGQEKFTFPLSPEELQPQPMAQAASLTPCFFLSFRGVIKSPRGPVSVAFVVNRYAEVVWLYGLSDPESVLDVGRAMGNGKYAFLGRPGVFEIADFDGTIEKSWTVADEDGPLDLHHDFLSENGNSLVALSNRMADYPGEAGSLLEAGRYLVGTITRMDLTSSHVTTLWDALDDGPLLYGPGWVENELDKPSGANHYHDFDHTNAISHLPGKGYLLSNRNFSTLLFYDESFRFEWSLGSAPGVTMDTKGTRYEFYRQHHAGLLPNGNILLLDNGRQHSRVLEIRVGANREVSLIREFRPDEPLWGQFQGSAYRLRNGDTLAFFLSQKLPPKGKHIVEFDREGREIGRMNLPLKLLGEGYRAMPLDTVGTETYLGPSLPSW